MDSPLQGFGMIVNNSAYDDDSPCIVVDRAIKTEESEEKQITCEEEEDEEEEEELGGNSSSCSDFMVSSSPSSLDCAPSDVSEKPLFGQTRMQKQGSTAFVEIEMMKERFSKLLLGEDMSGCGNGVSTALAISNAITNLSATVFGEIWRLEPLRAEKKSMWRREMEWLLCVSDYIVELIPSWHTCPDGTKLEVMTSRPRSDLYVNLPGLFKLDNMLLEILEGFSKTEFWYVEEALETRVPRQQEKWWLPVPRVPSGGLSHNARKHLQQKRDSTNQILKAAMAINTIALADMDVPQSFFQSLPKNAKDSLGDLIHRYVSSDQFSPERILDRLDLSSERQALEIANRVEASIYIWRRKNNTKPVNVLSRSLSRSSWDRVKDLVADTDKRETLADRARTLLLCLRNMFPALSQTTLDMTKIQHNKDVGKSILESYSRVLESLAFNIVARIDDLLYVDDLAISKSVEKPCTINKVTIPYKTTLTTPSLSPSQDGPGVKRVLTDYLSIDSKGKQYTNQVVRSNSFSGRTRDALQKMGLMASSGSTGVD